MYEQIIEGLPELQKIEATVAALEREHAEATARVQSLSLRAAQALEDDLNREATALNRGRKVPSATEPHLREQLDSAARDLEVLSRRLTLAQTDRALYISQHHKEIMGLLEAAHGAEGARVAAAAEAALTALTAYHRAEDDARNLQRLHPAPAQENVGGPESVSIVWGALTTQNLTGGTPRGTLEGVLRQLVALGAPTVIEAGGEDDEDVAVA
jgi:chromosome segregation ATPase